MTHRCATCRHWLKEAGTIDSGTCWSEDAQEDDTPDGFGISWGNKIKMFGKRRFGSDGKKCGGYEP